MMSAQWEHHRSFTPHPSFGGPLSAVPVTPMGTMPAMTVVAPPPGPPARAPARPIVRRRRHGHHPLVHVGLVVLGVATVARVWSGIMHAEFASQAAVLAMVLGTVAFVAGRMIRLDIHPDA